MFCNKSEEEGGMCCGYVSAAGAARRLHVRCQLAFGREATYGT